MTTALQTFDAPTRLETIEQLPEHIEEAMCESSDSSNGGSPPTTMSSEASPSNIYRDDAHIYTNLKEIEEQNNRPVPPTPSPGAVPKRDLHNGWFEFETDVGRTYFHHTESGKSQWIPPRFIRTPAQVQAILKATRSEMDETCTHVGNQMQPQTSIESVNESPQELDKQPEKIEQDEEVFDEVYEGDSFDDEDEVVEPVQSGDVSNASLVGLCSFSKKKFESEDLNVSNNTSTNSGASECESRKISTSSRGSTTVRRPSPNSLRSVSFSNRHSILRNVPLPQVLPTSSSSEMTQTLDRHFTRERCSSGNDTENERRGSVESREPVRTIRSGDMEKCEVKEDVATKSKKREWVTNFMYLTSAHLILYKDGKSAEKHGKHYDAPLGVWDLKGAEVTWFADKEKKKRKCIQLELSNAAKYLLRTVNDNDTSEWFIALSDVVAKLPAPASTSQAVIDVTTASVVRNPSSLSIRPLSQAIVSTSHKGSRRSGRGDVMTQSAIETSSVVDEARPSKATILEKLRRFFRTRPSMESLKEKGIYKPEPVFGSTLAAICQHESALVPKFIRVVIEVIESKGLDTDGIYRVSGNLSAVQRIRCQADQDNYKALVAEEDIHVLTGALKLFFRELSEPLFPVAMHKEYISTMQMPNQATRHRKFEDLLNKLPIENRETLKTLLRHLNRVASHSTKNRMQQHNLAIMFGPTLFHSGEQRDDRTRGKPAKKKTNKKEDAAPPVQSNSHLAFNMIMQSQIVQYLLESANKFDCLMAPIQYSK